MEDHKAKVHKMCIYVTLAYRVSLYNKRDLTFSLLLLPLLYRPFTGNENRVKVACLASLAPALYSQHYIHDLSLPLLTSLL